MKGRRTGIAGIALLVSYFVARWGVIAINAQYDTNDWKSLLWWLVAFHVLAVMGGLLIVTGVARWYLTRAET